MRVVQIVVKLVTFLIGCLQELMTDWLVISATMEHDKLERVTKPILIDSLEMGLSDNESYEIHESKDSCTSCKCDMDSFCLHSETQSHWSADFVDRIILSLHLSCMDMDFV